MQEVLERMNKFNWLEGVRPVVCDNEDRGIWVYFVLQNNILERNFRFDVAFKRMVKEELN